MTLVFIIHFRQLEHGSNCERVVAMQQSIACLPVTTNVLMSNSVSQSFTEELYSNYVMSNYGIPMHPYPFTPGTHISHSNKEIYGVLQ